MHNDVNTFLLFTTFADSRGQILALALFRLWSGEIAGYDAVCSVNILLVGTTVKRNDGVYTQI